MDTQQVAGRSDCQSEIARMVKDTANGEGDREGRRIIDVLEMEVPEMKPRLEGGAAASAISGSLLQAGCLTQILGH
jgi:hypothetical protein